MRPAAVQPPPGSSLLPPLALLADCLEAVDSRNREQRPPLAVLAATATECRRPQTAVSAPEEVSAAVAAAGSEVQGRNPGSA